METLEYLAENDAILLLTICFWAGVYWTIKGWIKAWRNPQ